MERITNRMTDGKINEWTQRLREERIHRQKEIKMNEQTGSQRVKQIDGREREEGIDIKRTNRQEN